MTENEQTITEEEITEETTEEVTAEEETVEEETPKSWYILQVHTGKENAVKNRIIEMIEHKQYQKFITKILVPEEETIELKNNKRIEKIARIFPGYVFVELQLDEHILYELRNVPGVLKFVGTKTTPTPVADDEILKVLRKAGDKTKKIDIDFEIDEMVKVVSGPFRGYAGSICEINAERGKLKALISVFGRETPVELDFDQVEKSNI